MQPQDFLAAVLPSSGYYCAVELSTKKRQHIFTGDLLTLEESIERFEQEDKNTYFALATFNQQGSREATNAAYIRAIFVDLDIGDGAKTYLSKKEAVIALNTFLEETKLGTLGTPWLVDSGGGVHAYWPLDKDATVAEWRPVADAFKRRAQELGFKIDMTVTADAARVLRPPGTTNHKYDPPRPVTLRHRGTVFSLAAIALLLGALALPAKAAVAEPLPGKRPSAVALTPTMQALTQNQTTLFKNILVKTVAGRGCGQVAHYMEHATEDGMEPLWRGLLSITSRCDDGQRAALKLTAMHPYTEERMHQKLAEIKGPYPCTAIDAQNPGVCGACPHWGKITNPLILGREMQVEATEKEFLIPDDAPRHPGAHLKRPLPPKGFTYGRNCSGVYILRAGVDGEPPTEVMLLPFEFFMVDVLQEGSTYSTRFAAIKKNSVVYVTIPNKAAGSKDEVIKALAGQNIIAAFGQGSDKGLYDYVRGAMGEASAGDTALRVPPNMGWQADGGFAVSDKVLLPHGQTYTYVSDRLTNIVNATATKGALGDWQRVMQMLQDKEMWGPLFFAAVGFGSPLMQWVGEGASAMVFHVCGNTSSAGKTLALSTCASVWGSPKYYPIIPTTSSVTMMQRAGLLGNLPLLIDEVTTKSRDSKNEWIPNYAFAFSQGGHKIKGSGSANTELDNNLFWNAISVVTSNDPQLENMMGARDTTSEGEARRLLEYVVTEPLEWTIPEREVLSMLDHNYGHAGHVYAQWLVDHADIAKEVLASSQQRWRNMVKAKDAERFWNSGCSAVLAGAILAGPGYANVFAFDSVALAKFAHRLVKHARSVIDANQQDAIDILNAYTREYHGQFVRFDRNSLEVAKFADGRLISRDSTKGRVAGRIEYDVQPGWVDYYIEINLLRRYCAQRNWNYSELFRRLQDPTVVATSKVVVTELRKNVLAKTNGPEMSVKCLKISKMIQDEAE